MALNISDTLKMLEKSPIAINIQDIIQKLTNLQAETALHSKKQIAIQCAYFSPISKEAFELLEKEDQQALAILVGRIYCGPQLLPEEIERMRRLIEDAKERQKEAYYTKGLELMENGGCGDLIAPETFKYLEPKFQEPLLRLVGKRALEGILSDADERSLLNLVQLAKLKQGNASQAKASFFPAPQSTNEGISSPSLVYHSLNYSGKK